MTRGRLVLRAIALGYLALLLVVPVGVVFYRAFEGGIGPAWEAVTTPPAQHAFFLTITVALIAVPANAVFGVACAWLLARYDFRGKRLLDAAIDLPFAVSPSTWRTASSRSTWRAPTRRPSCSRCSPWRCWCS